MRLLLWSALIGFAWPPVSGQERCVPMLAAQAPAHVLAQAAPSVFSTPITIPVVVHVLWATAAENISDDQILSQIESLNADFSRQNTDFSAVPAAFAVRAAATGIRFVLARTDPQGRPTQGILRHKTNAQIWINDDRIKSRRTGGSDPWNPQHYLNIWVGNLSSSLLGFSSFPGSAPEKDGIVIRYNVFGTRGQLSHPWNKGRTLTHEVGHWLGLRHLWGDTPCGDDGVDDTPRQKSANRGMPQFPLIKNECYNGPEGDMFMNFMDLSDDATLLMFTRGQAAMMRAQFEGYRKTFLSSKGAGEPWNLSPASNQDICVFPNPARESITITGIPAHTEVEVFDMQGRSVLSKNMGAGRLDLEFLPSGIYRLKVAGQIKSLQVQR